MPARATYRPDTVGGAADLARRAYACMTEARLSSARAALQYCHCDARDPVDYDYYQILEPVGLRWAGTVTKHGLGRHSSETVARDCMQDSRATASA
jgi:hypothetical protein